MCCALGYWGATTTTRGVARAKRYEKTRPTGREKKTMRFTAREEESAASGQATSICARGSKWDRFLARRVAVVDARNIRHPDGVVVVTAAAWGELGARRPSFRAGC